MNWLDKVKRFFIISIHAISSMDYKYATLRDKSNKSISLCLCLQFYVMFHVNSSKKLKKTSFVIWSFEYLLRMVLNDFKWRLWVIVSVSWTWYRLSFPLNNFCCVILRMLLLLLEVPVVRWHAKLEASVICVGFCRSKKWVFFFFSNVAKEWLNGPRMNSMEILIFVKIFNSLNIWINNVLHFRFDLLEVAWNRERYVMEILLIFRLIDWRKRWQLSERRSV